MKRIDNTESEVFWPLLMPHSLAGAMKLAHLMYYRCLSRHENKDMDMTFGAADLHEILSLVVVKLAAPERDSSSQARNGPIYHGFRALRKKRMTGLDLAGVRVVSAALPSSSLLSSSYHGGRQLDFARSGIEVLVGIVEKVKEKGHHFLE
ncbi:hypothetical protein BC826DRAFT_1175376 [Russula brevipes]|nr:hypothetical protein BC826DRAFT_1175376 [Russula brevipes]